MEENLLPTVANALQEKQEFKDEVFKYLWYGEANAITGKKLAAYLYESDTRNIRAAIRELVDEGCPVIGCNHGYYIASSIKECQQGMNELKGRLIEMAIRRRNLKRAIGVNFAGQQKLM